MRRSGCRGLPRVDCRAPRGLRLFSAPHKHDAQASGLRGLRLHSAPHKHDVQASGLRDRDRHVAALPVGSGDDVGRKSRHEQLALKGHNMSAQGKQPRVLAEIVRCVVGLHHAGPRLRSPGFGNHNNTQSPEGARQMTNRTNTDWQTATITGSEYRPTPQRTVDARSRPAFDSAALRGTSGNPGIDPWQLLRPFGAVADVCIGNPGRRERSQDSRSLSQG
jgi:hypothetical protein